MFGRTHHSSHLVLGFFFVGRFLTNDSTTLFFIGLFRLSFHDSVLAGFQEFIHCLFIVYFNKLFQFVGIYFLLQSLMTFCISVVSVVISPFVYNFEYSLFQLVQLNVIFVYLFKKPTLNFVDLFYFSSLYFIYFSSVISYLLLTLDLVYIFLVS